jgi:hypothetical protein
MVRAHPGRTSGGQRQLVEERGARGSLQVPLIGTAMPSPPITP